MSADLKTSEPVQPETVATQSDPASQSLPGPPPPIPFRCHRCGMHQLCNYHGDSPPFAPVVRLPADFYVKKNPFAPPPSSERPSAEYYLLLGADCSQCGRQICRATGCSVFYARTTCLACAQRCVAEFPTEIRAKINRALAEQQRE